VKEKGGGGIKMTNKGVNMIKVHHMHLWKYCDETPHSVQFNLCQYKSSLKNQTKLFSRMQAVLVGMWTSTAAIKICMVIPQKTKNRTTTLSSYTNSGYIINGIKDRIKIPVIAVFVMALFKIAKIWN
jgi:hypothetical protein